MSFAARAFPPIEAISRMVISAMTELSHKNIVLASNYFLDMLAGKE